MLFRKKVAKSCQYCACGTQINNDQVLCTKYGIVSLYYSCRKFEYDPCKRIPVKVKPLNFKKYDDDEDFSL